MSLMLLASLLLSLPSGAMATSASDTVLPVPAAPNLTPRGQIQAPAQPTVPARRGAPSSATGSGAPTQRIAQSVGGGPANATVIATIPVGVLPYEVAANPRTNRVYVTNNNDATVSVLDGASNNVITTFPVGFDP